jgi:hypothetical protein
MSPQMKTPTKRRKRRMENNLSLHRHEPKPHERRMHDRI